MPGTVVAAAELAERLEMSRTPVQEALKALSQEGFLRVVLRAGYMVTPVTVRDIEEIFELRLSNEVLGAGLAAGRATAEDVASLRAQHERAKANVRSGPPDDPARLESLIADNREFHVLVASLSGNQRLARIVGALLDEGQRIYYLYYRADRSPRAGDVHGNIIRALAARDPDAAREAMAVHLHDQRDGTLSSLS